MFTLKYLTVPLTGSYLARNCRALKYSLGTVVIIAGVLHIYQTHLSPDFLILCFMMIRCIARNFAWGNKGDLGDISPQRDPGAEPL